MSRHIDRISGPFPGRNLHWETWHCDFANKASQISGGQQSLWIEQELRYSRKRAFTLGKGCNQVLPTSILIMYTLGPQHRHQVCTQAGQTAPIRKRSSILFLAWKKIVYKVCPFGACFSAHWWGRLGGFILRIMHELAYLAHSGMLYVDDFIFTQDYKVLPIPSQPLFGFYFCKQFACPSPGVSANFHTPSIGLDGDFVLSQGSL